MNITELELLEKWQADPSFINWAKDTNAEDSAKWNKYFANHPQYVELADLAKFSILELQAFPQKVDKQKSQIALAALSRKIDASAQRSSKASIFRLSKVWQIAATVLFLVGISFWGYTSFENTQEEIVWRTELEKQEINLADGTKVTLNKHSRLSYFEKEVRNVHLKGEAFFEVAKNKTPFTVSTNDLVVKVLGTEFNVNTNKEQTSVFLDEGKVQLALGTSKTPSLEMQPGDLVSYSKKQDKVLENRKADALENTAWKENILYFDESTLTEVLSVVSKVYGVKFKQVAVTKNDQTFNGGIPNQNLDIAIAAIEKVFQLEIQKIEAQYLIESK